MLGYKKEDGASYAIILLKRVDVKRNRGKKT